MPAARLPAAYPYLGMDAEGRGGHGERAKIMKHILKIVILGALPFFLVGCGGSAAGAAYRHISSEEAQRMMQEETNYIILDVRTQKEYSEGHIPKAICIPNETIEKTPPKDLPDKKQMILVYCRSGRRSKEAAHKLTDMGYSNIVEFGGIIDWHGEITAE